MSLNIDKIKKYLYNLIVTKNTVKKQKDIYISKYKEGI